MHQIAARREGQINRNGREKDRETIPRRSETRHVHRRVSQVNPKMVKRETREFYSCRCRKRRDNFIKITRPQITPRGVWRHTSLTFSSRMRACVRACVRVHVSVARRKTEKRERETLYKRPFRRPAAKLDHVHEK